MPKTTDEDLERLEKKAGNVNHGAISQEFPIEGKTVGDVAPEKPPESPPEIVANEAFEEVLEEKQNQSKEKVEENPTQFSVKEFENGGEEKKNKLQEMLMQRRRDQGDVRAG